MTNEEFQQLLSRGVVMLDGATGTNLQQAGMPIGVCPEQWILENRQVMIDLQRHFVVLICVLLRGMDILQVFLTDTEK